MNHHIGNDAPFVIELERSTRVTADHLAHFLREQAMQKILAISSGKSQHATLRLVQYCDVPADRSVLGSE